MIIKSKNRKTTSFKQLIKYLFQNGGKGKNSIPFFITQNLTSIDTTGILHELLENEKQIGRIRKNGVRVIHDIISFHPNDSLFISEDTLRNVISEYFRLRSPKGMFLAVPHLDEGHIHIHICGSPWEVFGGKSLHFSRKEYRDFKLNLENFQIENYPELHYSKVNHKKKGKEFLHYDKSKPLINRIKESLHQSLFQSSSWSQFIQSIESSGMHVYSRGGRAQGVIVEKKKVRFKRLGLDLKIQIQEAQKSLVECLYQEKRKSPEIKKEIIN